MTVIDATEVPEHYSVANRVGLGLVWLILPLVGGVAAILFLLGSIAVALVQAAVPLVTSRPAPYVVPPHLDPSLWTRSTKRYNAGDRA